MVKINFKDKKLKNKDKENFKNKKLKQISNF